MSINEDALKIKLELKYIVLIIGVSISIIGCLYLFFILQEATSLTLNTKIETLSIVFTSGIGLTTLIYTAININLITYKSKIDEERYNENKEIERQRYSSYFIKEWYGETINHHHILLREYRTRLKTAINSQDNVEINKIKDELRNSLETRSSLIAMSNFLEHMCQEIEQKLADEKYLKSYFNLVLNECYYDFFWYIKEVREIHKTDDICFYMESVVRRWNHNGN